LKVCTISSECHVFLQVEYGVYFELDTVLTFFPQFRNVEPQCVCGVLWVCTVFFTIESTGASKACVGPKHTSLRIKKKKRFSIQFTFFTTKEVTMMSVNLSCISAVSFFKIISHCGDFHRGLCHRESFSAYFFICHLLV